MNKRLVPVKNNSGFSMIEILVAVLILAIGFLGVGGLQLLNMKTVNNTHYRTMATLHAYDMAERMRSNRDGVFAGSYNSIGRTTARSDSCSDAEGTCSIANLANADAYQWNNAIRDYSSTQPGDLPSGEGAVTQETAAPAGKIGGIYRITVSWEEQQRKGNTVSVEPESFSLLVRIEDEE